jgi:hypothetical protein
MLRQKKHKANSSSASFDLWSGMFIAALLAKEQGSEKQGYHQKRWEPNSVHREHVYS